MKWPAGKNCENTPNCIIWASKSWCSPFFSGPIFSYFFCTKCHFLDMKNYSVRNGGPCTRYILGIYKYEVTVGWPYGAHHCLYNLGVYRLVCLFYNFTGFKHILWRFCTIWPHLFPAPDMVLGRLWWISDWNLAGASHFLTLDKKIEFYFRIFSK